MAKRIRTGLSVAVAVGVLLSGEAAWAGEGDASTVVRVSTAADGGQLTGPSHIASISADGRYVAFWTGAPELGGEGESPHVLAVKDVRTGRVERVPGAQREDGAGIDNVPRISAKGRFVAYSTGYVGHRSAYLHDRRTGRTTHLVPPPGSPAGGGSGEVTSLSAHGRSVAFRATGPAPDGPVLDYVHDTVTGRTELITPKAPGDNAKYGIVRGVSLSGTGRWVAYVLDEPEGGGQDLFVRDRWTGTVRQGDLNPDGTPMGERRLRLGELSDNGRAVTFSAGFRRTPVRSGAPGWYGYVHDLRARHTRQVGRERGFPTAVSGDGRRVLENYDGRLTLHDLRTGEQYPVADGYLNHAAQHALSRDGRSVVFGSVLPDLVPGDTNGAYDVFVRRFDAGAGG
ncbi:hypothetical protein ADK76_21335 [Streptomyces griseoflavus]|uniref:TolB family protein n=1 Tax=Streptomyces rimosus TaxID=1927 RepID=UPI0004C4F24E|nr:hypothetical protein [Streptomyces rimosus]KOG55514.1 hypothetical protein ADK76_21335 [Streptomyces griseoflavus]